MSMAVSSSSVRPATSRTRARSRRCRGSSAGRSTGRGGSASLTRSAPGHAAARRPRRGARAHCIEVEKRHDVQVGFNTEGDLGYIHPDVALCLFRIAQEALRNGAVHGRARRLAVSIARSGEHVELTVTDDGEGFDLEAVRQRRQRPRTGQHGGASARGRRGRAHRSPGPDREPRFAFGSRQAPVQLRRWTTLHVHRGRRAIRPRDAVEHS